MFALLANVRLLQIFWVFVHVSNSEYSLTVSPSNSSKPFKLAVLGLFNNFYDPAEKPSWPIETTIEFPWPQHDPYLKPIGGVTRQCAVAAAQHLIDWLNKREDILPDYELQLHYYDGDIADIYLGHVIADFATQFYDGNLANNKAGAMSPIVFGPMSSPCATFYSMVPQVIWKYVRDFYQIAFFKAWKCEGSWEVPTMFESKYNTEISANALSTFGLMRYIKVSGWKQVGIVSVTGEKGDGPVSGAMDVFHLARLLQDNQVNVVYAAFSKSLTELLRQLKDKRVRIIFVAISYRLCSECIYLWCSTHAEGITAPKYVLLLPTEFCWSRCIARNITSAPESCPPIIQFQQSRIAIFSFFWAPPNPNSNWHGNNWRNVVEFSEDRLQHELQCSTAKSDAVNSLYFVMATTFRTLHIAEQRLRNSSTPHLGLMNFSSNTNLSRIIAKLISEIAAEDHYDNTPGIYKDINAAIMQSISNITTEVRWIKSIAVDIAQHNILSYNLQLKLNLTNSSKVTNFREPIWQTPTGRQPRDLSEILHLNGSHNSMAFLILLAFGSLSSVAQLCSCVFVLKKYRKKQREYFDYRNNSMVLLGCQILNISVVILTISHEFYPKEHCYFRPFLVIIGLSLCNSMIFFRSLALLEFAHFHRYIPRKFRKPEYFNLYDYETKREKHLEVVQYKVTKASMAFTLFTIVLLMVWFASDPMIFKSTVPGDFSDPPFDDDQDSYYDVRIEWCDSPSQLYWIIAFAFIHGAMLIVANGLPFTMKHKIRFVRRRFKPEINLTRALAANSSVVFFFTALVMLVTAKKPAILDYLQLTAFSGCVLLFSLSTWILVLTNLLNQRKKHRH